VNKKEHPIEFYVFTHQEGHNKKSSGLWQVFGKYNLRWKTTHDILHCVTIYLTKTRLKWRSHV